MDVNITTVTSQGLRLETMNTYRPGKFSIILSLLWLILCLTGAFFSLLNKSRPVSLTGFDFFMLSLMIFTPMLFFWWLGIVYRVIRKES
jgi:hypothetical protein